MTRFTLRRLQCGMPGIAPLLLVLAAGPGRDAAASTKIFTWIRDELGDCSFSA